VLAPDNGRRTPKYYKANKFTTWFKMSQITDAIEGDDATMELAPLAYTLPPHDYLLPVSDEDYLGRLVGGIDELLRFGNVTYWVVQKAEDGAQPAATPYLRPIPASIAPADVILCENNRILHLSDLHVSKTKHAFTLENGDAHNKTLAMALHEALSPQLPGAVIVTGDLTWTGSRAEFDLAAEVLEDVRAVLGLERQQFIIVPGNHDIQWTEEQHAKNEFNASGKVTIAPDDARKNYEEFYKAWYDTTPNEYLSVARRLFLSGGPTVDILGLSSVALHQIKDAFAGIGRVTESAIDESAKRFDWGTEIRPSLIRVVAVHHHVIPVIQVENPENSKDGFGIALDASMQLDRMATLNTNLVCHGHQHQPFIGSVQRQWIIGESLPPTTILIAGGGSVGVVDDHLGPVRQRTFSIMQFHHDFLTLELYSTHQNRLTFNKTGDAKAAWNGPWTKNGIRDDDR
jgi:predicted phosphodiesterase